MRTPGEMFQLHMQENQAIYDGIDFLTSTADSDPPPSVVRSFIERFTGNQQSSGVDVPSAKDLARKAGKAASIFGRSRAILVTKWVLQFSKRMIFAMGRFILRSVVMPVLTGIVSFLATPVGAVVGAALAAGGLGYLLYRTIFQGDNPASVVQDQEGLAAFGVRGRFYSDRDWEEETSKTEAFGEDMGVSSGRRPIEVVRDQTKAKGSAGSRQAAIVRAMNKAGMTDKEERAMFLAQLAHESGNFQYMHEIWGPTPTQQRYEGRKDLGNVNPGDGYKYRGRGFIQLTGRANYAAAGKYLGIDLVNNPDLASDPDVAAGIALWYWYIARPKISSAAQIGDVRFVTRQINGGLNGLSDRQNKYSQYLDKINKGEFGMESDSATSPEESSESSKAVTTKPKPRVAIPQQEEQSTMKAKERTFNNDPTEFFTLGGAVIGH